MDTPTSSRDKSTTLRIAKLTTQLLRKGAGEDIKTSNKCPAIILAAKRTAKVKGRIIDLMISIKTIKGINTLGVPLGTKWAIKELKVFDKANTIKLSHRHKPRGNVNLICLEAVKT